MGIGYKEQYFCVIRKKTSFKKLDFLILLVTIGSCNDGASFGAGVGIGWASICLGNGIGWFVLIFLLSPVLPWPFLEELCSDTIVVDVQNVPYFPVKIDVQNLHNLLAKIIDELEVSDIHLIEQYILEKEEKEAQEMEECIVELPSKQEIDRKMVVLAKMPVKISCEQEECVEMKTCNMSLPELFKAEESVHTDKIKLEIPEINAVEIKEVPRKWN